MHVDTITGMVYPLADVAKITRPRGILLVCDGAHAPGMLHMDLKLLGVDAFASSSHKWMLAPKGSGLLYIPARGPGSHTPYQPVFRIFRLFRLHGHS
jgi:selenocysteine lyase/cysteine desulfurase